MSAQVEEHPLDVGADQQIDNDETPRQKPALGGLDLRLLAIVLSSLLVSLGMILATPSNTVTLEDTANNEAVEAKDAEEEEPADDDSEVSYSNSSDVLGVFETRATAGDEAVRARNLQTVARSLNGIVIDPNTDLSMNEAVGEVSANRGYEDVIDVEYAADAVDQVASTLLIAALKSGLSVSERAAHMIPVSYIPLGMDAMVVWGMEDLVIHNDLKSGVTLQATATGTTVTISLLGVPNDPSLSFDVESQVVDTYTRTASEVYEDPLSQGLLSSDSVQFSMSETYLVTYRNEQELSRELLYADTYQLPGRPLTDSTEQPPT